MNHSRLLLQWRRVFRRAWNYIRMNWSQALVIESLIYTVGLGISCIATARSSSTQTFIPIIKRTGTLNLKIGPIYGDRKIIGGIKIWNM